MPWIDFGFPQPSLKWLHPRREVRCGCCNIAGTISRASRLSPHFAGAGAAAISSVCVLTTAGTLNSVVPYFWSFSRMKSAPSPNPGCVNSSCLIHICRNHSMCCYTVLEIVRITQPGSSSSLTLPNSVSWLSESSISSSSFKLARLLRLSPILFNSSWIVLSDSLVGNPILSVFLISSCSCLIAVTVPSTRMLTTAVSVSTSSWIHFSFSSFLIQCVSRRFSTASSFVDRKLRNGPRAWTHSSTMPLWKPFTWWHHHVERFVDLPCLPSGSGKTLFFRALTIVASVDYVVGRDVGCCKIWTIWRQAMSFMSRLVHLINLSKAKSAFSQLQKWESLCLPYNMTWLFASVSWNNLGTFWHKHHQMSFRMMNILCVSDNQEILAVVHLYLPHYKNEQYHTDILQIAGLWVTPATSSHMRQDIAWVECASWRLLIPFWLGADYIFLRPSHFISLLACSPIPHQYILVTETPRPGKCRSESSQSTGTWSHASLAAKHPQCSQTLEHRYAHQCTQWKCDPQCPFNDHPYDRKQQEEEAACIWMWVYPYRGEWPSTHSVT